MEWIIYAQYFVNDKKSLRTVWILVERRNWTLIREISSVNNSLESKLIQMRQLHFTLSSICKLNFVITAHTPLIVRARKSVYDSGYTITHWTHFTVSNPQIRLI